MEICQELLFIMLKILIRLLKNKTLGAEKCININIFMFKRYNNMISTIKSK